jgi:hypothetical protein
MHSFSGLYSLIFIEGDLFFIFVGQEAGQDHRRAEGQDLQRGQPEGRMREPRQVPLGDKGHAQPLCCQVSKGAHSVFNGTIARDIWRLVILSQKIQNTKHIIREKCRVCEELVHYTLVH